ncbi:MAG: DUF3570 domain-containing protein, partial [Sphingobacteriales bacterium]|nr:DUF3570 domain-containing protein [Sphingobacteriales bacterium]
YDKKNRKRQWNINLGLDYYTSASSDKIDPAFWSTASAQDYRFYPAITHTIVDDRKGISVSGNVAYSIESDYISYGFGGSFSKKSKDKSREFTGKAQCYLDIVKIILPIELRTMYTGGLPGYSNDHDYPWKSRNTFSTSFSLTQIVNRQFQLMFLLDLAYQQGILNLPFHRVYFKDNPDSANLPKAELLPSSRFKLPVGIRASYFLGDRIVLRSYYRYYEDSWGLAAHTADIETAIKFTPFLSVTPFYRFYTQNGIKYFAPYSQHAIAEKYYSSNYELSNFDSHFMGIGFRFAPPKGILGIPTFSMLEMRYGHYITTNTLVSDIISLQLKFK